jgi:predicted metalloprotease with PDZ domain
MKKIIFLFFIFCTTHFAWAEKKNNVYQYVADLIHVENNRIKIKLTTPTIETEEIIFFIPNSIPGTYEIFTYGRFIYNVQAWTKDNKESEVSLI